MAPQVGLEPTTLRLTAGCSSIELLRSVLGRARRARPLSSSSIISLAGGVGISKLRATARNFAWACILLRPVFCFGLCFASACVLLRPVFCFGLCLRGLFFSAGAFLVGAGAFGF